jgi:hypothetical protein
LAEEPKVRQKPDVWNKIVIVGSVGFAGFSASHIAGTHLPWFGIVIGAILGASFASWAWDFCSEKSGDQDSDRGRY